MAVYREGGFVAVEDVPISSPIATIGYQLMQNYPNPFNPETSISYQIPIWCHVEIKIYNIVGQEIRTLLDEKRDAGYHQIAWNGRDNSGQKVGTGIYIYQLKAEKFIISKKMILLQ